MASQPLGLTQLASLDRVFVRQKTTVFSGNKYVMFAPDNTPVLYAKEESNLMGQLFSGTSRSFNIDILDTQHQEVVRLRRPYTFGPDKMEVTVCGQLASVVRQQMTFMKPVLNINDAGDNPVLRVKGPISTSGEADFKVMTLDKKQIGSIYKKWGGAMREMFTESDNFIISFPVNLDVRYKAAIIGTCFLIDFLYYEK